MMDCLPPTSYQAANELSISMTSEASSPAPDPASETSAVSPTELPRTDTAARTSTATQPSANSSKKRAATGGLNAPPPKVTKRRAARACVSCRARKVRCDVVEGAPCGNCRWDSVECVVQESRRRKKNLVTASTAGHVPGSGAEAQQQPLPARSTPVPISSADELRRPRDDSIISQSLGDIDARLISGGLDSHVPHLTYQRSRYTPDAAALLNGNTDGSQRRLFPSTLNQAAPYDRRTAQFPSSLEEPDVSATLPVFVRPLPPKIVAEDVQFLRAKGALTLPGLPLQNALLQAYVEYVHPYMPLMELHDFLATVNARDGSCGQVSLLLYQAVMFAATAFVDIPLLRAAGYSTRKAARKAFFQKTRLLYDFDYEADRLILVQALLLMTYWYETPDDQKDTWHWMGVAISLAHTIGLHRNPAVMNMAPRKQNLWKRIWWSCFMRDRLIALGMRRPTRIKDEDFDVPMLEESDFEIDILPSDVTVIPPGCTLVRDLGMQQELAIMCIEKAKLCVCISHMLKAQYSVLARDKMRGDDTVNSTMMLLPNKHLDSMGRINMVDAELLAWSDGLPASCQYRPLTPLDAENGRATIAVQRTLLYMVYYTTVSALHRPQFLPYSPTSLPLASRQVQEMSRLRVRDAAVNTTRMAAELHHLRLEKYLPTTGVTVILPAMIIHLLDIKNPIHQVRERATKGFKTCMKVLEKLREMYSAADYATGFLDAALRKAAIDITPGDSTTQYGLKASLQQFSAQTPPPENAPYMTGSESVLASAPGNGALFVPPMGMAMAALDASATSPPHTERDLDSAVGGPTPSASSSSEVAPFDFDTDFMKGQEQFDWGGVTGTDFDVDQWLQFPAEGVNNPQDTLMGSFLIGEDSNLTIESTLGWAVASATGQDQLTTMDVDPRLSVAVQV